MSKQQPKEQHCDHECVCHRFIGSLAWRDGTRCMANQYGCKTCDQDTRSRPYSAPTLECPFRSEVPTRYTNIQGRDPWYLIRGSELVQLCFHHIHDNWIMELERVIRDRGEQDAAIAHKAREDYADELKMDIKTRFISSSNDWSKGRNSGLIECCNIIDESLRHPTTGQAGDQHE